MKTRLQLQNERMLAQINSGTRPIKVTHLPRKVTPKKPKKSRIILKKLKKKWKESTPREKTAFVVGTIAAGPIGGVAAVVASRIINKGKPKSRKKIGTLPPVIVRRPVKPKVFPVKVRRSGPAPTKFRKR